MKNNLFFVLSVSLFLGFYALTVKRQADVYGRHFQTIEERIIEKHHYHSRLCEELAEIADEAVRDGNFSEQEAAVFMNNCYARGE